MRQNSWRGQRFFIPLLHRTKSSGTDDLFQSFYAFSNAFFAAQRAARIEIDSFRTALLYFKKCTESRGQICSGEIPGPGLRTGRTGGRRS
jgi:hypothetical protein